MMSGSWQVAAETWCPLLHTGIEFKGGLAIVADTFRDAYSGSSVLAHLGRSFRVDEENYYGLRLSPKPLARDTIGQPVTRHIDNIIAVHLSMRYAGFLDPLSGRYRTGRSCFIFSESINNKASQYVLILIRDREGLWDPTRHILRVVSGGILQTL
jgi:hypothetical protein